LGGGIRGSGKNGADSGGGKNGGGRPPPGGNPLCESGPLLEPDQRTDVIFVSAPAHRSVPPWHRASHRASAAAAAAACLVPVACEVLVYPQNELLSDHYGVIATLVYDPHVSTISAGM
jgi:hypothetical protein